MIDPSFHLILIFLAESALYCLPAISLESISPKTSLSDLISFAFDLFFSSETDGVHSTTAGTAVLLGTSECFPKGNMILVSNNILSSNYNIIYNIIYNNIFIYYYLKRGIPLLPTTVRGN